MLQKKLLFVFNPHSGTGQIKNKLLCIIDVFTKAGYDVTAYPTQYPADAFRKVRDEGKSYDLIVCSGGDGTLDETVSGMIEGDIHSPLGYIPTGSTNDFANSLKIPKKMEAAAQIAVDGVPFLCDVGKMNEKTFVYVAAFGLFTDVSYQTDQGLKNVLGHVAYLLEGAKRLNQIQSYHVKVRFGGQELEEDLIYAMVSNSRFVGGMSNTELDDGMFEVLLVRMPKTVSDLNETLSCLASRKSDDKHVYSFKASSVEFDFIQQAPWTIDGEFGGTYEKVAIRNIQQAIPIKVKNQSNSLLLD